MPFAVFLFLICFVNSVFAGQMIELRKEIYSLDPNIPLSIFSEVRFPADKSIRIQKSRFVPNAEIASMFGQAGLRDFSLSGKGTMVYIVEHLTEPSEIVSQVQTRFPAYSIYAPETVLAGRFLLLELKTELTGDSIRCGLFGVAFRGSEGYLTNITAVLRASIPVIVSDTEAKIAEEVVAVQNTESVVTARALGGMQAELIYRKGGLEITARCQIVRRISGGQVLIKNPRSGKTMIVPLEWEEEK